MPQQLLEFEEAIAPAEQPAQPIMLPEHWGERVVIPQPLQESWGDVVPFSEFPQYDWPGRGIGGLYPVTTLSDREDGKFVPVFETETDLAMIRGMSRRLECMGPFIPSALSTLKVYTMGNGPTVTMVPKNPKAKPDKVTERMQAVLDRLVEDLAFPQLLNELHDRGRSDGEDITVLHPRGDDSVAAEIIEPDQLTEPFVTGDLTDWIADRFGIDCDAFVPSWKFGVLTQKRFTDKPLGYHVVYDPSGSDFEFYPAARVVHNRRNVPMKVKRGVSDWYVVWDDVRHEGKLAKAMGIGAGLQASIAWVEEMPAGTTQAQGKNVGATDALIPVPTMVNAGGGTRNQRATHYAPGTIARLSPGRKYSPGPLGAERNGNFELVGQMLRRRIGIRHQIPEYMISGDASNGNFASTLVAESPFVKAREADQEYMAGVGKALLWRSVALVQKTWCEELGITLEQLKAHYEIKVEFPKVQSRDPVALVTRLEKEKQNGWVSDHTAMSELGRDPDQEKALGAKAAEPSGMNPFGQLSGGLLRGPMQSLGASALTPAQSAALRGALESVESTDEARAILESITKAYP